MGRPALKKQRIKDPEKRREWIEQLIPIFISKGIKAISVDEVAAILGKSKATVYKHFDSHREIVSLIIQRKLEDLQLFQTLLNDPKKSYLSRYKLAVAYVSRNLGDVSNVFLSDLKSIYPDLWQLINSFKSLALSELRSFYSEGIKDEFFIDISPDLMVLSDELFFDALTDPDFLSSKGLNLQTAFDGYFQMRFFGILQPQQAM